MNTGTLVRVGVGLASLLLQYGCTRREEAAPGPEFATQSPGPRTGLNGKRAPAKLRVSQATLPEGTLLIVRTTSALSTKTHATGGSFSASLVEALTLNGREIAPRGAEVDGNILESDAGGRVKGLATLRVELTRLHTGPGSALEISTDSVRRDANTSKKKDALKIGIGSGVGAAIGAIAGGGKGAAIGAAAGAGAGTGAVLATHGDAAVIPSETVLQFALRRPVVIAQRR